MSQVEIVFSCAYRRCNLMSLYFRMTLQLCIVYGDCILDDVVFSVLYSQLELYSIQGVFWFDNFLFFLWLFFKSHPWRRFDSSLTSHSHQPWSWTPSLPGLVHLHSSTSILHHLKQAAWRPQSRCSINWLAIIPDPRLPPRLPLQFAYRFNSR